MFGLQRLNVAERQRLGPMVAVSTVAFALHNPTGTPTELHADAGLWIPLVRRVRDPFYGAWALPGGPTQWNQTLGETARETLVAASGATPNYLEQLYAFGSVERSAEAQRMVTIAYWAQFRPQDFAGTELPDDPNIAWWNTRELPELAFDHAEIIRAGITRLQKRAEQTLIAHRFLDESFRLRSCAGCTRRSGGRGWIRRIFVGKHWRAESSRTPAPPKPVPSTGRRSTTDSLARKSKNHAFSCRFDHAKGGPGSHLRHGAAR